ncbi:SRPBCC family protein [Tranquillimonas rosea]|uniref:SRPBCC family protein n=1 Tax=Tranquillimonas rosea TaxID=641238 RepID=UPI003BAA6569
MKFSTRTDVEAPHDFVFASVSDFEYFERQALRRGVKLRRTDGFGARGQGVAWTGEFTYRGRQREAEAQVAQFDPGTFYTIEGTTGGLEVTYRVEVIALSRRRSRLMMSIDLRPQTLSARLLVQSLKLAKGNLSRRFETRVAEYGAKLADRHAARAV